MSASARLAPTTFFREIDRNRRRSWLLVAVVVVVLGLLGGAIGYATGFGWGGVILAVGVATALSIGSWFAGDALVMATSGAREIDRANPGEPFTQLVNVVEEMRLAGGLPPPRLWVIDDSAPNAFATGRDPQHASVAVTTGLLDKLDREQLQGVIGHEMSHIGNLDIRFTLLVELTRNPVGLARALRTISDDREVLEVANRATQHLYIVNPIKSFEERAKSLWDTHPPIGERIRQLENIAGQMGLTTGR
jgi:Zn-dependent protease with chaperone function